MEVRFLNGLNEMEITFNVKPEWVREQGQLELLPIEDRWRTLIYPVTLADGVQAELVCRIQLTLRKRMSRRARGSEGKTEVDLSDLNPL